MKSKFFLISILLISLTFISQKRARASHAMGIDLTYQCLGSNTYTFQLAFYRDCGGATAPASAVINFRSPSCNQNFTRTLFFVSSGETSPICASLTTECNGGAFPGAEEYIYRGTYTLPAQCPDWVMSYSLCCRNNDITTINNPGGANIYTEALLNNTLPTCNSSPSFSNDPVPFVCSNQGYCFNNGAIDADGDSLAYFLVTPKTGPNLADTVVFLGGFTSKNPITSSPPLTLDPFTGDLCMNPTDSNEIGVLAVRVEEYRNGVLIGSIRRDIQLRILSCPSGNSSPVASGINGTGVYNMKVCAGDTLDFLINSIDPDAGQVVTMNWNNAIPTASFTITGTPRPTGHFVWSPAMTEIRANPYCFTVGVTDDNCPFYASQVYSYCIYVTGVTSLIDSIREPSCFSYCDGTGAVQIVNGTPPFTYQWNDPSGQSTPVANGLCSGIYTITGVDSVGCTTTTMIALGEPNLLTVTGQVTSNYNGRDVSCFDSNDGSATGKPAGGTPPYIYSWDSNANNQVSDTAVGLKAGTYSFTVTDNNGCDTFASVTLTNPPLLTGLTQVVSNYNGRMVSCNGASDGMLDVNAAGGTLPYTYLWDANAMNQTNDTASGLMSGVYSVVVTDANGCDTTLKDSLKQTPSIVTTTNVISNYNGSPISCNGLNDGMAKVMAVGGTAPFTYQWGPGTGNQANDTAFNLTAGKFMVTATDINNCKKSDSVFLTQPAPVHATILSKINVGCNGDSTASITAGASGGLVPYQYSWNTIPVITDSIIQNIPAGNYTIVAKDVNNCSDDTTVTISQPLVLTSAVNVTSNYNGRQISCTGLNDGMATSVPAGGTPPYTFAWGVNAGNQTNDTAFNLAAGLYAVTVTDSNGCDTTVNVTLNDPPLLTGQTQVASNYNGRMISCVGSNDGRLKATGIGGTGPYTYLWGSNAFNQVNDTAFGLPRGTYSVTITDVNGCDTTLTDSLLDPPSITTSPFIASDYNGSAISCNGQSDGHVGVLAGGGTAPFTYLWDPSTGSQANDTAYNLPAGTYSVVVTDANGCQKPGVITLTQPAPLIVSIASKKDVYCNGQSTGEGVATANGGTSPYRYSWSTIPVVNGPIITGLQFGIYNVTVTDTNGCTDNINLAIGESQPLIVNAAGIDLVCNGANDGKAYTNPMGGVPPYKYNWTTNTGPQLTDTARNLSQGWHHVVVIDSLNCTSIDSVMLNEPQAIMVNISSNDTVCSGQTSTLSASASGGNGAPFTWVWNNGLGNQPTHDVNPTISTVYILQVKDNKGCVSNSAVTNVFIRNFAKDSLSVGKTGDICEGDTAAVFGKHVANFDNYTYTWTPAIESDIGPISVMPKTTTMYVLTISDQCGNNISDSVLVEVYPNPVINLPDTIAAGCQPLEVIFEDSSNHLPGYSFAWTFGDGGSSIDPTPTHVFRESGTFKIGVTVTSDKGCTSNSAAAGLVEIYKRPVVEISASPLTTTTQNSQIHFTNSTLFATKYLWDFGDGDSTTIDNPSHTYQDSGTYRIWLIASSGNGCVDSSDLLLRIDPYFDIKIPNAFSPNPFHASGGTYDPNAMNNDVFFPHTTGVQNYHLMIWNRWGELIFESFEHAVGWDGYYKGKLAQQEVYVWELDIRWINGQSLKKVGDLTLFR